MVERRSETSGALLRLADSTNRCRKNPERNERFLWGRYRPELVMACLGVSEETVMTPEHIVKLVREGYLRPLERRYRNVSVYPAGGTRQQRSEFLRLLNKEGEP